MKLKYGATRCVFLAGNYAVKIPRMHTWRNFLYGLLANMQEIEKHNAKYPGLCPLLWYLPGGFINIMPRAQPITDEYYELIGEAYWTKWGDTDDYYVNVENKICSFGWLNGAIVAVDYG